MLETLRIAVTLGAFASFLGIVWWAYAPSRRAEWESRGRLDELEFGDGALTPETPRSPSAHDPLVRGSATATRMQVR